jgi:predicted permease
MFCVGVAVRNHPISIGQWNRVIPFLVVHHFVNPLIATAWAFALKADTVSARACVLLWTMPVDWTGAWLALKSGSPRNVVTATAVWSHLIVLPTFLIWLAILGTTGLFA